MHTYGRGDCAKLLFLEKLHIAMSIITSFREIVPSPLLTSLMYFVRD